MRSSLPVDAILPEVLSALRTGQSVVVRAPTGSGKTTRLPPAMLDGLASELQGEIVVLEPRRLAARLPAEWVATERGEAIGETVGYHVRFEERRSARTRLRYVTTGVLLRALRSNPELRGIGALVFDELHERHVEADVLLAWARRLQQGPRPDLRLVAMSATLDAGPLAEFLGGCRIVVSEGRTFPVTVEHLQRDDDRPLHVQVATTLRRLVEAAPLDGDLLVFLPGEAELRASQSALSRVAEEARLDVVLLHGSLSPEETRAALRPRPPGTRKVLLATNVAESSVTLDGIVAVIDSGLHKVARASPWTGLSSLAVEPIPKDSATQRAGRAGRTQPGRCLRLFTEPDLERRPGSLDPELRRADLAPWALLLAGLGVVEPRALEWLSPPDEARWDAACALLRRLGALETSGSLTAEGRALLELPVHPRLGVLARTAHGLGYSRSGALAAALLGEDARLEPGLPDSPSDVVVLLEAFERRRLHPGLADRVAKTARELGDARDRGPMGERDEALGKAVLHAFPDRFGRRRDGEGARGLSERVTLAAGVDARLDPRSTVRHGTHLVALDADGGARPVVRLASAVETEWLWELPNAEASLTEAVEVRWDDAAERVDAVRVLRFEGIPIETTRLKSARGVPEATQLLRQKARQAGLGRFTDAEALAMLVQRCRFARTVETTFPAFDETSAFATLDGLCQGAQSFRDLREADLLAAVVSELGHATMQRLDRLAPLRVPLAGGRTGKVVYTAEGAPRVSARIQWFLGLPRGPRIGDGKVPLLLELLAPNGRPAQVTSDLEGFWERTWPAVRKELRGRYPRHAWPESPLELMRDE